MNLGRLGHLSYSTLVHPGDNWELMSHSLRTYVPQVKARVSPNQPFGLSLRLAAPSAETLVKDQAARDALKRFLADNGMYLYTVNAFPYGAFKDTIVKEQVYEPDWRTEERTQYTINVADILADVAPEGLAPSIQSAPLGFKPRVTGPDVVASYTEHVLRVVAHLVGIESRTGKTVTLALEPEPHCFLETTDETIDYFNNHLYSGRSAERLAKLADIPVSDAIGALRRHLGVVFDIGHQAVGFEDIPASLQKLVDAGVPILKLQEVAAMHMPNVTDETVEALQRFAKTVYLSQTVEKKNGKITKFLNLEDAFAARKADPGAPREWRTHFHVPVFLDDLGGKFGTTRFALEAALKMHKEKPLSGQLEIETYTWDVLPDHLKTGDIVDYVCREIEWVRGQLV
ncbi:MAG TPA: metabolite traffic protein EboE [Bryobacteraceae bacterium]|nr:metabolite traffic protein EboE [Bryobacteraceae bacterium]